MIRLTGLVSLPSVGLFGSRRLEPIVEDSPTEDPSVDQAADVGTEQQHEYPAKAQLMTAHEQTGELYNMLGDDEQLEAWAQDKLNSALTDIGTVFNYIKYEKNKPNSLGNGDGLPADATSGELP